jgi:hypothetical protein
LIEKRNKEEEAIEELIKEFEAKIELLYAMISRKPLNRNILRKMTNG